jgi:hypothetical protein
MIGVGLRVLVAGAGIGGLGTARALRQRGLAVGAGAVRPLGQLAWRFATECHRS